MSDGVNLERPLTDLWDVFPAMPDHLIDQQPPDVWQAVETTIWRHRHSVVRHITRTAAGSEVPAGWLRPEHFETLGALDVPVRQLFTALTIRLRGDA